MDALTDLFTMEDFRRPGYLVDWLSDALAKHKSGIFHLEMETGMGRSTFAQALDPRRCIGKMEISLEDTTVRGYCINASYLASEEAFCNSIPGIFNRDKDGARIFQASEVCLQYLRPGSPATIQQLVDFLSFYRGAFRQYYGTSRLLLVIDGLEEIPTGQARSVLDALPGPGWLSEGTYILLTTRLAEDLPPQLQGAAALQEVTEHFRVDRLHDGYRAMLRGYAKETIPDDPDVDVLLEKAESRFLYLRPLRSLSGDELHGETTLMAILASAYEPLTLEEVAFLSGRDKVDSRMLAGLAELRVFLKTERSDRGNLIFLHAEWKAAKKKVLEKTIRGLVEGWIAECSSLPHEKIDAGNEGLCYLLSRLTDYCAEYGFAGPLRSGAIAALLRAAADALRGESGSFSAVERRFLMLESAVKIYERLLEMGEDVEDKLAGVYLERGNVFLERKEEQSALDDHNRALDIRQRLDEEERLSERNRLADVYLARGNVFKEMYNPQFAVADLDMAVQIREKLDQEGRLLNRDLLAGAYLVRGNFFYHDGKHEKAANDLSRALEILEALDSGDRLRDRAQLMRAYMDRGHSYAFSGMALESTLADLDRALSVAEKLEAEGGLPNKGSLARIHLSRGYTLTRMHRMYDAIAAYDRFLQMTSPSNEEDTPFSPGTLADVHLNRGRALDEIGQPESAMVDFDGALEILVRLDGEGRLLDRSNLVKAHRRRGDFFKLRSQPGNAVAEYDRAIEILTKRYEIGMYVDQNDVANLHCDRGAAFMGQRQPERAILDFSKAIDMMDMLESDAELRDKRDFADGHRRRGDAYAELRKFEDAVADYDAVIEILDTRSSGAKYSDPMALSDAFERRGAVRSELGDLDGAESDYNRAVDITEQVVALGRFFHRNEPRGAALDENAGPNVRTQFLERVRDSILGQRVWRRLGLDEVRSLRLERNPVVLHSYVSSWRFEVVRFDLPFYQNASLLELRSEATGSLWFLERGGSMALLDGTSAPIHEANAVYPLNLTGENLVDYLRFYNFFVHGVEGPFFIADDLTHPMLDQTRLTAEQKSLLEKNLRAPLIVARPVSGLYWINAFAIYGDALFSATFVLSGGRVEKRDEKRIAEKLPVKELKFLRESAN